MNRPITALAAEPRYRAYHCELRIPAQSESQELLAVVEPNVSRLEIVLEHLRFLRRKARS